MKKILFLLLGVVAFAACKDDDDNGWDNALSPGSKFQTEITLLSKSVKEGSSGVDWPYNLFSTEFTLVDGEHDGAPVVSLSGLDLDGYYCRLSLPTSVFNNDRIYYLVALADRCLNNKSTILSVKLDGYLERVGKEVFMGASLLEELTIGPRLRTIGDWAFRACPKLPILVWNNSTAEIKIGGWAFAECTALETVDIAVKEAHIESGAFMDCTGLNVVTISGEKLDFDDDVFMGCTGLVNVTIRGEELSFRKGVFDGCTGLKKLTLGNMGKTLEGGFFLDFASLEDVVIESGLKVVKNGAFKDCPNLKTVDFPGTLDRIEAGAFQNCPSLEIIYITGGDHLVEIDELPEGAHVVYD